MSTGYLARQACASDWVKIASAFSHSFTTFREQDVWNWRYQLLRPSLDFVSASVCVTPVGEVVGFCAATVHEASYNYRPVKVLISRDSFSRPLSVKTLGKSASPFLLANREFNQHNSLRYDIALGFGSHRRSILGIKTSGATPFSTGQWLGINLQGVNKTSGSICMVQKADFSDDVWNSFWTLRAQDIQLGIVKDQFFLNWRFNPKQGNEYWSFAFFSATTSIPLGYVVLTPKSKEVAVIVDSAFPRDLDNIRHALQKIQNWLYYKGIRRVETFSTPGCPEYQIWPLLGFQTFEIDLQTMPIFKSYHAQLSDSIIQASYAMTLADSDLY